MSKNDGEQAPRTWIVQVGSRAGFRFTEDQRITIVASDQSVAHMLGIRLRNGRAWASTDTSEGAPTYVSDFVSEAVGLFGTVEQAVGVLGNIAAPYFNVMATVTNAGAEESEDLIAYSPPPNAKDEGEFLVQRHSQPRSPAARLRKVSAQDAMDVLGLMMNHPREEGLYRAMAHFRQALNYLDPQNRVLAAQSLWLAIENLTHVVLDRLREENGLPSGKPKSYKHQLALTMGFEPKILDDDPLVLKLLMKLGVVRPEQIKRDGSHLTKLDRHVRLDIILDGDKECYGHLNEMSNGFEHGYKDFGDIQALSKVADRAFGHIRRAILMEIGLQPEHPLFDERFDTPQGIWRPAFQGQGVYSDTNTKPGVLTKQNFNDDWPDPPGLSLVPVLQAILDKDDGTRELTLKVNGSTAGMPDTQTASLKTSVWVSPGGADAKVFSQKSTVELNGDVVEEQIDIPAADGDGPDDTGEN